MTSRHLSRAARLMSETAILCPANSPPTFRLGDRVKKRNGGRGRGQVVGWYRTALTPEGYAVESAFEPGSVQIYPVTALDPWREGNA